MENKNILNIAIALTIGVILAGSLLMPVLNDATKTTETITNTGAYYMTDSDEEYTLIYDPSGKLTVNGEDIAFSALPVTQNTLVSTEEFLIRLVNYSAYEFWIIGNGVSSKLASSSSTDSVTLTFTNGTLTVGENTYSYTSDTFRGVATSGNYVMTASDSSAKINYDTTIIVGDGVTNVSAWNNRFYLSGTVEDMDVTPSDASITVSNVVVNTTAVDGYADLVELSSVTFTATYEDTSVDATYNRIIVPVEVTGELSQHLGSGEIAILNAIPVMVIAALVITALGAFITARRD